MCAAGIACSVSERWTISFTNVDTVDKLPAKPSFIPSSINLHLFSSSVCNNKAAHKTDMRQAHTLQMSVPTGKYFKQFIADC